LPIDSEYAVSSNEFFPYRERNWLAGNHERSFGIPMVPPDRAEVKLSEAPFQLLCIPWSDSGGGLPYAYAPALGVGQFEDDAVSRTRFQFESRIAPDGNLSVPVSRNRAGGWAPGPFSDTSGNNITAPFSNVFGSVRVIIMEPTENRAEMVRLLRSSWMLHEGWAKAIRQHNAARNRPSLSIATGQFGLRLHAGNVIAIRLEAYQAK
jgi:hypothetical protein